MFDSVGSQKYKQNIVELYGISHNLNFFLKFHLKNPDKNKKYVGYSSSNFGTAYDILGF